MHVKPVFSHVRVRDALRLPIESGLIRLYADAFLANAVLCCSAHASQAIRSATPHVVTVLALHCVPLVNALTRDAL